MLAVLGTNCDRPLRYWPKVTGVESNDRLKPGSLLRAVYRVFLLN